ncbi:uncharacterized protein LOC134325512 [Trichomycterus rosablanca]|uniref:uncharacterized protein LOC134325512 n=1 Tax=Trichomycterus rosablanca TaxID=2290929 RepID=UPI002F3526E5
MADQDPQNPQRQVTFIDRYNSRGIKEISVRGMHLSIPELTEQMEKAAKKKELKPKPKMLDYLIKAQSNLIPNYPNPVEFVVSDLTHVTEKSGFEGILKSEQFRSPVDDFSWWSLYINEEEIKSAEKRYLEKNAPSRAQQPDNPEPFLEKFTTSPLFKAPRYGNYRFKFPLAELIEQYKEQNCEGMEPVFRVFKTVTYKQEIMYVVLVHSPEENEVFENVPLLEESEWVSYKDGQIIWKAQAICETHCYSLSPELEAEQVARGSEQYYVWDHACLAFYIPRKTSRALKFPRKRLIEVLEACRLDDIDISRNKSGADKEFLYQEAVRRVSELKKELKD